MKKEILDALIEKYGIHMRIKEIASVLKIQPRSLLNKIYAGKFPVATWSSGRYRIASTKDVADYVSTQQTQADEELVQLKKVLNS